MAMNPVNNAGAVVVDANVLIALSAKETDKETTAQAAVAYYANNGYDFYAPGVIISETLYILCGKAQSGVLTPSEYVKALQSFQKTMRNVFPPPQGDASLIGRAEQIRNGYGCSRSADGLYIALAEELAQTRITRLLTFDIDLPKQAAKNAPTVHVHLLTF